MKQKNNYSKENEDAFLYAMLGGFIGGLCASGMLLDALKISLW